MDGIKGDQKGIEENTGLHTWLCRGIIAVYFFIMVVIYPLYAPGGYVRIGEVKYFFFRNVTLVMLAVVGSVIVLAALVRRDQEWIVRQYRRMSVTDWFAYGYCLVVMVSYLCSDYKKDALWGAEGWYMGVMSQLMFVLLYFFFSRFFCCGRWLGLWLFISAIVFLLGICNRYSIYPVVMEGQTETFISTLGNINWFCGYWSVTATIGIMLYWCSAKGAGRVFWGIYSLIAMLSGVTQGSSSAYLVYLTILIVLFVLSLSGNVKMYRFLELCMIFTTACQIGRFMQKLPGFVYNYGVEQQGKSTGITGILLDSNVVTGIFLLLVGFYLVLRVLDRGGYFRLEKFRRRGILTVGVAVVGLMGVFFTVMRDDAVQFRKTAFTVESDGYLKVIPDENWGNGRGATWNCGVNAYRYMDSFHKFVGVGPDCFADYIYDVPQLASRTIGEFANMRLTNAHNEWMTVLVNTGGLGLLCYAGIYVTAFIRFMKRAGKKPLFHVCAIALLAYTVHNMVSFQQILSTPYIFMVLGIGEGLVREDECKRVQPDGDLAILDGQQAEGQICQDNNTGE